MNNSGIKPYWREYRTASDVYRAIVDDEVLKGFTVVVTGRCGPTGKTTLCKLLVNAGVNAIELSENLVSTYAMPMHRDITKNKIVIHPDYETIIVSMDRLRTSNE